MADKDNDKGQEFVSQRNLKNQLFGKNKEDTGFLNKTMSSFVTKQSKLFKSLDNSIQQLNKNILGMTKATDKKKSFVKREDPSVKLYKAVDGLEALMTESNKIAKENNKKKGDFLTGLLKGAAMALAAGGLLGFLMTGKKEFLFSVIKGFKKAFLDIPLMMFKGLKGAKSLFKIVDVIKDIGKFGNLLGKVFSKFGMSGVTKLVGKKLGGAGSKMALKKIPGIGTIMGLIFGIERFKKGDVIGGIGEIVSGVASMFPGPGTAISLAVDALLLLKDFKSMGKKKEAKTKKSNKTDWSKVPVIGSYIDFFEGIKMMFGGSPILGIKRALLGLNTFGIPGVDFLISKTLFPMVDATEWLVKSTASLTTKAVKGAIAIAPMAYEGLKKVPVIGWYIQGIEGLINFAKDPKKGVENIAGFMNNMVPGSGDLLLKVGGAIFGASEWIMSKGKDALSWLQNKDAAVVSNLGDAIKLKNAQAPTKPKPIGVFSKLKSVAGKLTSALGFKTGAGGVAGPIPGLQFANSSVDFTGLDPSLQNNFLGMVNEWRNLPENAKRIVQINSANRSIAQQEALVRSKPGLAAPAGKSMHNFGRAIDINQREANDMWKSGIMKKWGFEQPGVQNGWKKPEPWHIEPIGQSSSLVRAGLAKPMDTPSAKTGVGDAYSLQSMTGRNLPSSSIGGNPSPIKTNNKIDLSEATIRALAEAMGSSFSRAIPKGNSTGAKSASVAMRG